MKLLPLQPDILEATARYSPCKLYRYSLTRVWSGQGGRVAFIGLNPSTATEEADDPTVRRCINFARDWGAGSMTMLNIFSLRSTDPKGLYAIPDPVGPENDQALVEWAARAGQVVACWGNHGALMGRGAAVRRLLGGVALDCFKITGQGQPIHPLYLPKAARPTPLG